MTAGEPNLELWLPLGAPWGGEDGEIAPEDCLFYDVDGRPHSVEPNLHTREWYDEGSCYARQVDTIRDRAKPISRAQFEFMRWKLGCAKREADEKKREAA